MDRGIKDSFSNNKSDIADKITETEETTSELHKKLERDKVLIRWLDFTNIGGVIEGTRFRAFKVPLGKEKVCKKIPEEKHFTPNMLLTAEPNLRLIIDLTSNTRFYDKNFFLQNNIDYAKIYCGGNIVPPEDVLQTFYNVVEKFTNMHKPQTSIIGVHCTHGINRTGYFICRYMIDKLGFDSREAVSRFQKARGHEICIPEFIEKLYYKTKTRQPMIFGLRKLFSRREIDVYERAYDKAKILSMHDKSRQKVKNI